MSRLSTALAAAALSCLIWSAAPQIALAETYRFAVEAADVPSVRIWLQAVAQSEIAPIADKKIGKRTRIGDRDYFVLSLPKERASKANRFCADVPDGWLVKWNGAFYGEDGGPGRTLCTTVGPLTWVDGVTYHRLETSSEAAQIALGSGFKYDIGPGVPDSQLTLIKTGFWLADGFVERMVGGTMSPDERARITVKIEATGKGNQEPGGGGGCCTGLSGGYARPYFDVKHKEWAQPVAGRGWSQATDEMKTVIDEYVHAWHATLGALTPQGQPLGNWMNSGIAEYVAYSTLINAGRMSQKDADRMEFSSAVGAGELKPTLQSLQAVETPIWPGHAGYVAIQWLVASSPNGLSSLHIVAASIGEGKTVDEAFYAAFGITLADFYPQFEAWKPAIIKNWAKALSKRPRLVLSKAPPKPPAPPTPAEMTADELFRLGYIADTGDGGPRDAAEAVKWYTLAAAKGQHEAERNLAGIYGSGRGVIQNDTEARRLFTLAAEGGDAQAQYALGEWYSEGRDFSIKWFRLAAKQGHAEAIAALKKLGVGLQ